MPRRALIAVALALAFLGIALVIVLTHLHVGRPSGEVPIGQTVTLVFSKDAWVRCLSHPESSAKVLSVVPNGLVVLEVTPNIALVTAEPLHSAPCKGEGIVALASDPQRYFVPFVALRKVVLGTRVVWENPGAV